MTEDVRCPACGAVNRVPESRAGEPARCGKCKTPLATVDALPCARSVMRLLPTQVRTVVIILLVVFAWFVWPTPYRDLSRYEHINRITGAICPVSQTCWINPRMW